MIIYNHVVNQCEDQKLILSQIFNTPIYKPNYSCIEFQDFEVTWGWKKSYRGHIQLMSFGENWNWSLKPTKNSFNITEFQHLKVTGSNLGRIDFRSFEVNNENNYTVDFCEGLNSSLSWYLGWTFRVLFWTFVVYFWIFNFGLSSDYRDCVTIRLSNFIKNSSNFHQNVTAGQTKILVLNQR